MIEEWKVRERAYVLWEKDDRPEGSDKFYWRLAQEQLEAQGQPSGNDTAQGHDNRRYAPDKHHQPAAGDQRTHIRTIGNKAFQQDNRHGQLQRETALTQRQQL